MVTRQGTRIHSAIELTTLTGEPKPFVRNVFTLNTCAHIVGSQVLEFKEERQLLVEWRKFVEKTDPDMIIGYNIANFDLPYLLDRAKALKIQEFAYLGRLVGKLMDCVSCVSDESKVSKLKSKIPIFPQKLTVNETLKP